MSRSLLLLSALPLALVACQPDFDEGDKDTDSDTDGGTDSDTDGGTDSDTDDDDTDVTVSGTLLLNELMPSNRSTVADESGAYPDWLELYNPGSADVSLAGWTISDNLDEPDKHELAAELSVPAGGFLVLWADKDTEDGPLHVDFNLAADGEDLGIYDADGNPADIVTFGAMAEDLSVARVPDGSDNWEIVESATPGASNGGR
jgi:hypothetical protein